MSLHAACRMPSMPKAHGAAEPEGPSCSFSGLAATRNNKPGTFQVAPRPRPALRHHVFPRVAPRIAATLDQAMLAPRMPATLLLLLVSLQQLAPAGKQPRILFILSDGCVYQTRAKKSTCVCTGACAFPRAQAPQKYPGRLACSSPPRTRTTPAQLQHAQVSAIAQRARASACHRPQILA